MTKYTICGPLWSLLLALVFTYRYIKNIINVFVMSGNDPLLRIKDIFLFFHIQINYFLSQYKGHKTAPTTKDVQIIYTF